MTQAVSPFEDEELEVRTARKDGKQVVTMRSLRRGGQVLVECEVYPVSALQVDPLLPGPYRFATAADAAAFVEEAAQALVFLGCQMS